MTVASIFILAAIVAVSVSLAIVKIAQWLTDWYINWRF
ncbi:hypothetical protein LCGC14_0792270 [marine sediment metagenome]|uniref:Uncharacterized protein n=1 Tax=marine sediment metagenome TaxID=412755 RepID=A0A0F9QC15_9ZZZZ